MVIGEVGMEVSIPFLMTRIVNIGVANGDTPYIVKTGLAMIGMAALSLVFGILVSRFSATAGAGFAKNLRAALFNKVQDFSFANIDKFNTASLVTRLTTDVNNTQMTYMMVTRMFARSPIMLICAVIFAMNINAELAVIFLLVTPVLAVALAVIMSMAYPRFREMLGAYDKMNAAVQEDLIGIHAVKAFVREDYENEKFEKEAGKVRETMLRAERCVIWIMPIMTLLISACIVAIVWFGGNKIIYGSMMAGDLMSFITYTMQILVSLMMFGMVFMMYVVSRASMTRIAEVLEEKPGIVNPSAPIFTVDDGSVEYQNVMFRYREGSGEATLKNINLKINAGESVGIVGSTGSAKTTLAQLLPRLYDINGGKLLVGGHDVRDYDLKTLRDSVAMVLQKNVLFSGSIRDNLRWGDKTATDEEIAEACRIAQAHEFIMGFPNGYDADLVQGGANLSGGQKQRLCIARALLKKPKIMILDDSTSAVDTATDSKIRHNLSSRLAHMTTIIIAQRIASVMDADKIVVLDEGEIKGVGTHEELLRTSAIYNEIYRLQQKGGDKDAV
ncbi:MAG: ABC transporter ATP-binding protein/permease [Clostridiales bacterium]|nr:ABC transporter ATP-binding protein/permease [Clostridiales bacterium]